MHWFGVTAAQTLTEVTETHKQTDHMNQQGLAGRVMIKQAQSHLQFLLNSVFFFSQTSKRNCHPRCETHSAALPKTSYTLETRGGSFVVCETLFGVVFKTLKKQPKKMTQNGSA